MNDGNLGLAVGDVCGKDVPAALLTSSLHSMIRALRFARTFSLKTLVRNIDKLFSEICPDNCYATLFVGEYDPSSGRLHYVNAGHEPPFVLRKTGPHFQTIFLEASGPVIGMLRESSIARVWYLSTPAIYWWRTRMDCVKPPTARERNGDGRGS